VRFFIVPDMLRCVLHTLLSFWFLVGVVKLTVMCVFLGTPPCSAAATFAAGVSVSREEGRRSAGRGLVVAVGGKGGVSPVGRETRRVKGEGVVMVDNIWRSGLYSRRSPSGLGENREKSGCDTGMFWGARATTNQHNPRDDEKWALSAEGTCHVFSSDMVSIRSGLTRATQARAASRLGSLF
jgi:hypothetical protein